MHIAPDIWKGYFEGKSCQNLSLNLPTLQGYSLWAKENNGPKKPAVKTYL